MGLDFPAYDVQRGVVHDHVMEHQQADPLVTFTLGMGQLHQGRLAQVEAVTAWVEAFAQVCEGVGPFKRQGFAHQRGFAPYHLDGRVQVFPVQRGAQYVVALDDPLQGVGECVQVGLAGKAQLHL